MWKFVELSVSYCCITNHPECRGLKNHFFSAPQCRLLFPIYLKAPSCLRPWALLQIFSHPPAVLALPVLIREPGFQERAWQSTQGPWNANV